MADLAPAIARYNCLLRGREIALGLPEPKISTSRDALLRIWQTASEKERADINARCEAAARLLSIPEESTNGIRHATRL